jgi:hypothetical protein
MPLIQLDRLAREGSIKANTLAWTHSMQDWSNTETALPQLFTHEALGD